MKLKLSVLDGPTGSRNDMLQQAQQDLDPKFASFPLPAVQDVRKTIFDA